MTSSPADASIDTRGAPPVRGAAPGWKRLAPALLPWLLLVGAGLYGVRFGAHWDEDKQIEALERAVEAGRLLPEWYNYPSMCFWLTCASLAPELVELAVLRERAYTRVGYPKTRAELLGTVRSSAFRHRVRCVFVLAGSLLVLWTYLAVAARRTPLEALCAATLLAGSWEIGYHLRWIAPDVIVAQFAALWLLLLSLAQRAGAGRTARRWLLAAAACAGAAASTKYPAGLLLVPVLGIAWRAASGARARLLAQCLGLFAATYLLITPGTLLEPVQFYQGLRYERWHYTELGHYGFTVEPGLDHYGRMLYYLGRELLSPFDAAALLWAALAALGLAALLRRDAAGAAWLFLAFPLLYLLYFGSTRVLFVRNLLVLAPFLAILAARGAFQALGAVRPRWARISLGSALAALVAAGLVFQAHAAWTIRQRGSDRWFLELADYLRAHPSERFHLAPKVAAAFARLEVELPNTTGATGDDGTAVDALVIFGSEGKRRGGMQSNRPGFARALFGPRDVNFPWYTPWPQRPILVVDPGVAREMGIVE